MSHIVVTTKKKKDVYLAVGIADVIAPKVVLISSIVRDTRHFIHVDVVFDLSTSKRQ